MATTPAALLLAPHQRPLALRGGPGGDVVHACSGGDGLDGALVVAGDHDGADARAAQLVEVFPHPVLDDVLKVDDAEFPGAGPVARSRARAP
jgi:hypothetical protein